MSTENSFLDENYEVPTSGGGYTKLEMGENRMRILSSPVLMWVEWREGSVSRHPFTTKEDKPKVGPGEKDSVKHAWGLKIWNYNTGKIEVFELDKQNVITALTAYSKDKDWGHPKKYDIVIKKEGSGMKTEYSLITKPHSEATDEIYEAYTENPIDLSKLLINESPFMSSTGTAEAPAKAPAKEVTAENWTKGDAIPSGYEADGDGIKKKKRPF
jgi:hypothetical protein